jgi:hypothetical protein
MDPTSVSEAKNTEKMKELERKQEEDRNIREELRRKTVMEAEKKREENKKWKEKHGKRGGKNWRENLLEQQKAVENSAEVRRGIP